MRTAPSSDVKTRQGAEAGVAGAARLPTGRDRPQTAQCPCALTTPLTVRRSGREGKEEKHARIRAQRPLASKVGLGRRGGAAPCVVTLCERALGQLGSPRGLSVVETAAPRGRTGPRPPLQPRRARQPVPPPPARSLKGAPASDPGWRGPGPVLGVIPPLRAAH